jgi:hypothetical protein
MNINVCCIALPTGETLWFRDYSDDYLRQVIAMWTAEHQDLADTGCTIGCVIISMPEERFNAVPATNSFAFPETGTPI